MTSIVLALAAAAAAQVAAPQATSNEIAEARALGYAQAQAALAETAGQPVATASAIAPGAIANIARRPVLWRNIEDGMTVSQLHALYPQAANVTYKGDRTVLSDVPILDGCQAKVNIMHPGGVVKEIVMRGDGAIAGRCSIKIITALSGKYGEPMDKDKVRGSLFGREGKNYIWAHDGITLQMKRYTNGPLGGGGLLAASWEMRYSANAANIDL